MKIKNTDIFLQDNNIVMSKDEFAQRLQGAYLDGYEDDTDDMSYGESQATKVFDKLQELRYKTRLMEISDGVMGLYKSLGNITEMVTDLMEENMKEDGAKQT